MTEHIKMPAITPLVRLVASGSQTVFAYNFPIFASEDLAVYLDGARQVSGYTITGAGTTSGGSVTFAAAPASGVVVTLARELPIERVTDFTEGGEFSALALNTELDMMVAGVQQVARANGAMLRYGDHEAPAGVVLPDREMRAGKALGFDEDGNPVAVSLEGSMAAPDFTPAGTGAATRSSHDKFSDMVSVKDFGAVGDGVHNDTVCIQNALAAHNAVFVPRGTYRITATIALTARQSLIGAGQFSVIACADNSFNAVEMTEDFITLADLRITGGAAGIKLFGKTRPCVQNAIRDVSIFNANVGVLLDGHNDTNKPCYWNNFDRVLVESPVTHGFHLTKTGAGDTPNANKFHACRVYSHGSDISGAGFYVEHGQYNNAFIDCEANIKGTGTGCFIIWARGRTKRCSSTPMRRVSIPCRM